MDIIQLLVKEFEEEAHRTRKMLDRIPDDNWDYMPHEKSMSLKSLAIHIAELPQWPQLGLTTSELDFATMDYTPTPIANKEELLKLFETSKDNGLAALKGAKEDDLLPDWVLRNGEQIYMTMTKYEMIRHSISQTIHHRAQLGVYLRLLDIPLPGTYGPSADEGF